MPRNFSIPFPIDALRFSKAVKEFRETFPDVPEHMAAEIVTDMIEDSAIDPDQINEYHGEQLRLNYCL